MEIPKSYRENRPWGEELWFTNDLPSKVKILVVSPGEAFSLQYHHNRDEFWHVISGNGTVEIGENKVETKAGDDHFVPRETKHRVTGGTEPLVFLELAQGEFDEKDIVRIEDRYGRV